MAISPQALIDKFKYALNNKYGYVWGTAGVLWTAAKQKAATREQTVKYGSKWIGHYVADCSGLFTWAFKQLGGTMYHGSNTMYKSYCTAKGKLTKGKRSDGMTILPGTAVFTGTEGDHGHVGLYVGDGKVIEAKGTQYGVVESNVTDKKWTYWGELKGVDYGQETPDTSGTDTTNIHPVLRRGDKGQYVTELQKTLISKGFSCGSCGADGDFGSATEKAVKAFQKAAGLTADGIVGAKTWEALESNLMRETRYTVTVKGLCAEDAADIANKYKNVTVTEE